MDPMREWYFLSHDADEDDGGKLYIKVRVLQSARCL